jgi:hypothetical protein
MAAGPFPGVELMPLHENEKSIGFWRNDFAGKRFYG